MTLLFICLSILLDAFALRLSALDDIKQGETERAQQKLITAYEQFVDSGRYDMASMCLYERAIEYLNTSQYDAMRAQMDALRNLQQLSHNQRNTPAIYPIVADYNYHSVASAYYSQVDSIDLAKEHGRLSIVAMEQLPYDTAYYRYRILPVWNYYNQALYYDIYTDPPQLDSIALYLAKARHAAERLTIPLDSLESMVSICDLEAWLLYYRGDYRGATETMQHVLTLIDAVQQLSPNTVITERSESLKFMAQLHAEQGHWQEAYDYQGQALDNDALRYDIEKREVLQEIETRYEVEKKQLLLDNLTARHRATRWILTALVIALVAAVLLTITLYLRKKNIEGRLYEAALEADNMQASLQAMAERTDVDPLRILANELAAQVAASPLAAQATTFTPIANLDLSTIQAVIAQGRRITTMDRRYILCFAAGMTVEQVALLMHVDPASVYTVRYRLRKKFPADFTFPY